GNTSTVGGGGLFFFESNLPSGTYEIVLSRDGINFDPGSPENKVLNGYMDAPGVQTVSWDGFANNRQPFPVGTFSYGITIRGGEYHFPMSDVENNPIGGPIYNLLNATNPRGNTVGFYDHRGYYTLDNNIVPDRDPGDGDPTDDALCGNNPPFPPAADLVTGSDSAMPGFNRFGSATTGGNTHVACNGAFGDTKVLDIWTYFPSEPPLTDLIVVNPTDFGDAPDIATSTGTGDYSTLAQHNGPVHAITASHISLGDTVTDDSNGFGDGVDNSGNATDDVDDALMALAAPPVSGQYVLNDIPIRNETGQAATLHAWIDFNRNGAFEAGEYVSAAIAPTESTADLTWTVPAVVSPGISYARFRLTTDTLSDNATTTFFDERSVGVASNGEVEDYQITLLAAGSAPQVLLVKRVTAIAGQRDSNPNDGTPLNQFVDVTAGPQAPDDNHPHWPTNYIVGATHGGETRTESDRAADSVEYTIYFLSAGGRSARGVLLCDRIPDNTLLLQDAYREGPPADPAGSQPNPLTIALDFQGSELSLTGADDGDAGYYFPPTVDPRSRFPNLNCGGTNDTGAIVVDLGNLPNATGPATPVDSYGALRFQVRVQ
ncbi:MAG: GEVED domain-containing protein, partial [Cyanobacteria bacterium J06649_4]